MRGQWQHGVIYDGSETLCEAFCPWSYEYGKRLCLDTTASQDLLTYIWTIPAFSPSLTGV